MQLTKKRALNTEDEIYAHTYTDEREKELIRQVHEANLKLKEMGIDPDDPNSKERALQQRSGSINSDDSRDGAPLGAEDAGDDDDEFG